jgi:hypothetical protein
MVHIWTESCRSGSQSPGCGIDFGKFLSDFVPWAFGARALSMVHIWTESCRSGSQSPGCGTDFGKFLSDFVPWAFGARALSMVHIWTESCRSGSQSPGCGTDFGKFLSDFVPWAFGARALSMVHIWTEICRSGSQSPGHATEFGKFLSDSVPWCTISKLLFGRLCSLVLSMCESGRRPSHISRNTSVSIVMHGHMTPALSLECTSLVPQILPRLLTWQTWQTLQFFCGGFKVHVSPPTTHREEADSYNMGLVTHHFQSHFLDYKVCCYSSKVMAPQT